VVDGNYFDVMNIPFDRARIHSGDTPDAAHAV
jgi:hypothetical protein